MTMFCTLFKIILLAFVIYTFADEEGCPQKCSCKRSTQKDGYLKMTCGEKDKISNIEEIELLNVSVELVQLNLSDNYLQSFSPLAELIALQKLDLSRNLLTELQANQFNSVPNLRRLDISGNSIKYIDLLAFDNLKHLERLKLSQNQINTITFGTFGPIENFKQLDISNNPLICDCGLLWILDWSQRNSVKLISNPKCSAPITFKNQLLRKLKIGDDIHCKSAAGSSVELKPHENQVVFEGDTLSMQCYAPSISDSYEESLRSKLEWTWLGSDPKQSFSDLRVVDQTLPSAGRIWSTLTIPILKKNHTGLWNCLFLSVHGNHSEGITIVVISDETKYCPMSLTSNNKGTYNWPRTIVNYTVTIPCESLNLNYDATYQKASYFCSEHGEWMNLNTSMCSYISETTKILEQFSKVNSSIEESAKHFRNYTLNQSIFKDLMDLVFAVDTVENYVKYAPFEHIGTISSILMDVVNNFLELPRFYVRQTDSEYGTSNKLLNSTENLGILSSSSPSFHKSNIALEVFQVKKDGFQGMKCTWYVNPHDRKDSVFSCGSSQHDIIGFSTLGKSREASVTIPSNLFGQLQLEQKMNLTNKVYNLLVAMHYSSKLFSMEEWRRSKEDVTTAVVGVKLVDITVKNLSTPVFIMLRTPPTILYEVMPFTPVWWDPSLNNATGGWSTEGCYFRHALQDHVVFSCDNFGYYGLMQDVSHLKTAQAKFKLSHPAIYVGTFILFTSLLVVILTYLLCYATIQMPKKAKHSLVNTWISISLLCFMYVFGIYQTEDVKVCQIVGMILHYFTLCSLLWMCVGVNCMYKRLNKNDIINLQDDDLPSEQPIRKPILGLYLVGWGIGLIVCGLSAAINMNEYASPRHCFLRSGPALSALYIPFVILAMFLFVFFLLIRCTIYNLDANGHLSEGTQATEHVDLDLLEPNFPNMDGERIVDTRSISTKTASSELEDPEHAPSAQLKAYIIFLFIYVMTWLSCAFATMSPFHLISYEEDLFSIAFAILATTLSAFTLFFYCVARNDVRTQWVAMTRWMKRKRICFRSRNISDTPPPIPQIQIQPLPLPPVSALEGQIVSRSTSRSSSHTKSNSHMSNILKGAVDLNGSFSDHQGAKINNVNLVVLHRAQYRSNAIPNIIENPTNAAEVFYNPHQSTVARKFFKRQKRNMMKKNNLVKPPRDINSDTASVFSEPKLSIKNSEQHIFGTNSKVNNTNIHVEHVRKVQQKNPNLFSDSADDFDLVNNLPVDNIAIHAERVRKRELCKAKTKKKQNNPNKSLSERTENNMRSVSQQCTLDYSSETISDSVLDKTSPEKSLLPSQECFMPETSGEQPSIRRENSPLSISTENDPNYCQINDLRADNIRKEYFQKSGQDPYHRKTKSKLGSELSYSLVDSSLCGTSSPRIYINPSHELRLGKTDGRSRASSLSVSDLDELYQQIRRGPLPKRGRNIYVSHASPCLSDSEINSFVSDIKQGARISRSRTDFDLLSDDIETTV